MPLRLPAFLTGKQKVVKYHLNGNISEIYNINSKTGQKSGVYYSFDENGFKLVCAKYKDNKLHGKHKEFTKGFEYSLKAKSKYKLGQLQNKKIYNPAYGKIEKEEYYTNGVMTKLDEYDDLAYSTLYGIEYISEFSMNGKLMRKSKYFSGSFSSLWYQENYDDKGRLHGKCTYHGDDGNYIYKTYEHGELMHDTTNDSKTKPVKQKDILRLVGGKSK